MTVALYPLTFTPKLQDYVWGGRNLERLYGRTLPPGIIAESWEISAHPDAATEVDYGPLEGWTLPQLLAEYGAALVGRQAGWALERDRFPLLIKLLDANQNLSVQVHPDDGYAWQHEDGELGKTEMWYVLHAEPEARVIFGLKGGTTPESFRRAIENKTLENQLHDQPIKAGDTIFVKAGSVHALLKGTVVAEIQQNSNITYRVYDWDRVGADGKPRPLHVEQALQVINFAQIEPGPYEPQVVYQGDGLTRAEISRCDYFVVEKVTFEAGAAYHGRTDGTSLEIWGTVEGHTRLTWSGPPVDLLAIRFGLIPATLGDFVVEAAGKATMLRVYLP